MAKQENRRKSEPRVMTRILVDYESKDTFLFDYSRDLSSGGVYIETDNPLSEGQTLNLRFSLPGVDKVFNVEGRVAWTNPPKARKKSVGPGMGVEFVDLEGPDRELLQGYVNQP